MGNELVPVSSANELVTLAAQAAADLDIKRIKEEMSSYTPSIKFMTATTDECKSGAFPINRYGLFRSKEPIDLGAEIHVLYIGHRMLALDTKVQPVVAVYDFKSQTFRDIIEKSKVKDSGCMWGFQTLFWLPDFEEGIFAMMHWGSKSARNESGIFVPGALGKVLKLGGQKLANATHEWYSPRVTITQAVPSRMPDMETAAKVIQDFNNPKSMQAPETASAEEKAAATRAR